MKILVLIKEVPDTWSQRRLDSVTGRIDRDASDPVIDEIGERSIEAALNHRDKNPDTDVVVMTMGRPGAATTALRKALALGATSAVHITDARLAGSDLGWTALALAAAIRSEAPDLVIAGNESTDGRGGVIPAMLAEHLGVPHLTGLVSLDIRGDSVSGERVESATTIVVEAPLPAVVSITERMPEARFASFKGTMGAKKKPLRTVSAAELGIEAALESLPRSVVLSVTARPARTPGPRIVDDGRAGVELADFLHGLHLLQGHANV